MTNDARRRIAAAYDPATLRQLGGRLIDLLAGHLAAVESRACPVLPWRPPAENVAAAAAELTQPVDGFDRDALADRFAHLVQSMLAGGINLQHPRYVGHQVASSVPLAGLFDAVGAVTNQAMAIYDMGPWATAAEQAMVDVLGREIGWTPGQFAGTVTHGGSLANLTALLTARNVALEGAWVGGVPANAALLVHADAHYSVARAAGVLGIGSGNVVRVGLDGRRRMDPARLADGLAALARQGRRPVAVVACSCSTPVGAFDPLTEIGDVCRRHGVWLHVDAAHGGSACLSPRYRPLLAGLERADSIAWDAHKMLFCPALCAFVFYREAGRRFEAFRQDAPYLFDPAAPGLADFDSALRTIECTKRAAAFGLWGLWALFGRQLFVDLVETTFDLGRTLYDKLAAADDFTPLHEPQCNIVVFRHTPARARDWPAETVGRFQLELRRRTIESGEFYMVSTKIDGAGALRTTLINPLTTADDLDRLLDTLRSAGRRLLDEWAV